MDYSVVNTTSFRSVSDTTFDRFFEAEMARNGEHLGYCFKNKCWVKILTMYCLMLLFSFMSFPQKPSPFATKRRFGRPRPEQRHRYLPLRQLSRSQVSTLCTVPITLRFWRSDFIIFSVFWLFFSVCMAAVPWHARHCLHRCQCLEVSVSH